MITSLIVTLTKYSLECANGKPTFYMIKQMKMKIMQHSITNYIKNGVHGKFIFITKN